MTTVLPPHSAYPPSIDDLLVQARQLVAELGQVPSRNELMRRLRIGAPKASALRDELAAELTRPDPWAYAEQTLPDLADLPDVDEPDLVLPAGPDTPPAAPVEPPSPQVSRDGHPDTPATERRARPVAVWPLILLALPAFVAVWSGWVGLGGLTGFGVVHPLPGIADSVSLDSAITLPIGVETYAAYALYVWLSGRVPGRARRFAKWSAIGSLLVGALGQVAYHLLVAAGRTAAPWPITMLVACLPVAVLGMGAALAHLVREES